MTRSDLAPGQIQALINEASEKIYQIPYSSRTKISARTIERYLKFYREKGFEGLKPQVRSPKCTRIPEEYLEKAALDLFENKGKTLVLVIEEAQTLEASVLFELRFLLNYRQDSFSPLAIILVGESALKASLRAYHMSGI